MLRVLVVLSVKEVVVLLLDGLEMVILVDEFKE